MVRQFSSESVGSPPLKGVASLESGKVVLEYARERDKRVGGIEMRASKKSWTARPGLERKRAVGRFVRVSMQITVIYRKTFTMH